MNYPQAVVGGLGNTAGARPVESKILHTALDRLINARCHVDNAYERLNNIAARLLSPTPPNPITNAGEFANQKIPEPNAFEERLGHQTAQLEQVAAQLHQVIDRLDRAI